MIMPTNTVEAKTKRPHGPDLMVELEGMSLEELVTEKIANLEVLRQIKEQIAQAQARVFAIGEYSNPEWWRRVHSAQKIRGLRDQAIQTRMAQLKLQYHKANAERDANRQPKVRVLIYPQVFIEVCKEWLAADVFASIEQEATNRISARSTP